MDERESPGTAVRCLARADGAELHLEGVVGVRAAQPLLEAARQALAASGPVTVHLARAEYLDGAALQVLLALREGLRGRGRELRLVSAPPSIEEMLRITGLAGTLAAGVTP